MFTLALKHPILTYPSDRVVNSVVWPVGAPNGLDKKNWRSGLEVVLAVFTRCRLSCSVTFGHVISYYY